MMTYATPASDVIQRFIRNPLLFQPVPQCCRSIDCFYRSKIFNPSRPFNSAGWIAKTHEMNDMEMEEELVRFLEVPTHSRDDSGEEENRRKRSRTHSLVPRVMKNDIRRHYAPMFMNTINSADIRVMQDFFNTFMARPCRLVGDQATSPEFELPSRIIAEGPRLTAHYLLGVFLMFPDMVVTLTDSKIITSNTWSGTKIVIEVDVRGTKVASLPIEAWIPHKDSLPELYQQTSLSDMVQLVRSTSPNYFDFSAPVDETGASIHPYGPSVTVVTVDGSSASTVAPQLAPGYARTYIPATFIGKLCEGLVPLAQPLLLHTAGKIEFYLDENNHIQHVNLALIQQAPTIPK